MNGLGIASPKNIQSDLEHINQFNSTPGKGITRVLFTEEEINARLYIKRRMKDLGLEIREDAIGNIFGKLKGSEPQLPPIWTGSHIDTVLNAGQFDGMVGVVGALEAIRLIKETKLPRKRNIEVVVFTSEEPTRFGKGCLGSRALAGKLTLEDAQNMFDEEGNSLAEVLENLNYNLNEFKNIKVAQGSVHAFIELHIEQGAVLESLGVPIGIVNTISAPTDIHVNVVGKQGHAGSTPMNMRQDALMAAAEIFLKLESLARVSRSSNTVGTIGKVKVFPNASNVIPGEVFFTIDIRDSDFSSKETLVKKIKCFINSISFIRDVNISVNVINHDCPKNAAKHIVEAIKASCNERHYAYHEMVSGAYHDAMFVAEFAPFGMIFVPSKNGISHDAKEWTDYNDIAKGVDVLASTLLKLCND